MTTPDKRRESDPVEAADCLRDAPASDETTHPFQQRDDASPELRLVELTQVRAEHRCPQCEDLEHSRKQAESERDLSKVTDFSVLIARHRARHQVTP
ncbi:hypothetical protein SLV14_003133 [Streptomyces sp. Je 1-4]|uniref:hypothetical protein n=1 Tax=Streptomyces TaxID=1883 RepID=UPI0021DB7623|nr:MULTISPECIES: hypothetical protein [unclassified Streptomyces]UYB40502.1 hypothetical protein SLV14_003133 [Streptomyces sp. Je 1-4]UZQ36628.1 hypothetical protein SLV14N_003133 [Streptomyces sp. Je 1-4] [Streptomyces sp. Je 1-4 4N24]UZQ44045.1 hypothetical protein SLV14NA_003133 [Streptomyces sp. Je 1-4] [Streptomyces sp. Je 1-4 4N24_ara]